IGAGLVLGVVLAREGALGACLAEHGVLLGAQLGAPLLVGLLHLVGHGPHGSRAVAATGRLGDMETTQIRLAQRPVGEPGPDTFTTATETVPDLEEGQVLLAICYL